VRDHWQTEENLKLLIINLSEDPVMNAEVESTAEKDKASGVKRRLNVENDLDEAVVTLTTID
jgi:hypothetical protein